VEILEVIGLEPEREKTMKLSYRKSLLRVNRFGFGAVLLIVSGGFTRAQGLPPDVGIITQLSGGVTYQNEAYQKTPEKAQVFMKILQGDYFQLEEKAIVELVYFRSGRKETWKGAAGFIAGGVQSQIEWKRGSVSARGEDPAFEGFKWGAACPGFVTAGRNQSFRLHAGTRPGCKPAEIQNAQQGRIAEIAMAKENFRSFGDKGAMIHP